MIRIFLLLLLLPAGILAQNSQYFIAPDGSDNTGNGSKKKPWFTINKAWENVSAGDVIYLRGGNYYYDNDQLITKKNGTAEKPIKIQAYQNEKPVISPSGSYNGKVGISVRDVSYLHLKGLEICNYKQRTPDAWYSGISASEIRNCTFELLNIHHNGFGMSVSGRATGEPATGNLFLNCDFHHNYDNLTAIGDNFAYGGSDGLTIRVNHPNSVNTVIGCRMYNNSDDGFDGWTNAGLLIFENCWAFNNGFREDGKTQGGDGNGFKFGPMCPPPWTGYENEHKRTFVNCAAFYNRVHGFDQNRTYCIKHLYNNTSYKNGGSGFNMNQEKTEVNVVKNNISYQNARGQAYFNPVSILDHNTFTADNKVNPVYSVSDDDFISLDTTGVTGPRGPKGELPSLPFLRLRENSDLAGHGANIEGSGANIKVTPASLGAFEFKEK